MNRIFTSEDKILDVGITDFSTLKGMVAEKRQSGISPQH